jgi:hypothetical protein
MDTFPDSPVPNKQTVPRDTGSVQKRNRSGRPLVLNEGTERSGHFQHFI